MRLLPMRAWPPRWELTLFARCVVLMTWEVLANAFIWILTAILFTRHGGDRQVMSLALVAWTTGLRHGLDADHISAIDNATRRIVSLTRTTRSPSGRVSTARTRRPVTVGLFFSLGHSTIVFAVTVAIAVSADVANRLGSVGSVGGIIGDAVSGSFLVLIGCINTVILFKTWSRLRRRNRSILESRDDGAAVPSSDTEAAGSPRREGHFTGCMTCVALPLLKMVDRPWKMYPVGVLFGLGFDTASSIALLGVAAIALQNAGSKGSTSGDSKVILLALLFTAGMTMVDSADSCLMIWAYAPEKNGEGAQRLALTRPRGADETVGEVQEMTGGTMESASDYYRKQKENESERPGAAKPTPGVRSEAAAAGNGASASDEEMRSGRPPTQAERVCAKIDAPASKLSLALTLLSIFVAFAIGIIVLLGLIGDECDRCSRAADKQENRGEGGLEGRWWLTWRRANDNSGYVGAGIVGVFAVCVLAWAGVSYVGKRRARHGSSRLL